MLFNELLRIFCFLFQSEAFERGQGIFHEQAPQGAALLARN